jgi:hypothetical protein
VIPVGKYPPKDSRIEHDREMCGSDGDTFSSEVDTKNLYHLNRMNSIDGYVNFCEDCGSECSSNEHQVCKCSDLHDFTITQNGQDSTVFPVCEVTGVGNQTEVESCSSKCTLAITDNTYHERDAEDVTSDHRGLDTTHSNNDSGIECGSPN